MVISFGVLVKSPKQLRADTVMRYQSAAALLHTGADQKAVRYRRARHERLYRREENSNGFS